MPLPKLPTLIPTVSNDDVASIRFSVPIPLALSPKKVIFCDTNLPPSLILRFPTPATPMVV